MWQFAAVLGTPGSAKATPAAGAVENERLSSTPAKQRRASTKGDAIASSELDDESPVDTKSKGKSTLAKGGKAKGKQRGRPSAASTAVDDVKEEIPAETQTERRAARVVAEDSLKYSADTVTRCPLPGYDSKGIRNYLSLFFIVYVNI